MRAEEYRAMFDLEDRLWWYEGMRAITLAILYPHLRRTQNPVILDVGCGTGYSIAWMKEQLITEHVFGVDYSSDAAAFWRERSIDTVSLASAANLPFASNRFDLITCFDVIYQFTAENACASVAEMQRTLKPGGLLFIREPAYDWMRGAHDTAVATRHRFTRREMKELLIEEGFTIKRATYANTLLFGAAVAHRLFSRVRREDSSDVKAVASWMNRSFSKVLSLEARWLRRWSFPFGLSVILLAEKL